MHTFHDGSRQSIDAMPLISRVQRAGNWALRAPTTGMESTGSLPTRAAVEGFDSDGMRTTSLKCADLDDC